MEPLLVGKFLSDGEKELFLKKLHQYVMRFRETPKAIPLMSAYLDIVYVLCRKTLVKSKESKHASFSSSSSSSTASSSSGGRGRSVSFAKNVGSAKKAASQHHKSSSSAARRANNLSHLLQQPFTSALMSPNPTQREQFFSLFLSNLQRRSKLNDDFSRMKTAMEYDWEPVAARFWISLASGVLLSGVAGNGRMSLDGSMESFESFTHRVVIDLDVRQSKKRRREEEKSPFLAAIESQRLMERQRKFLASASSLSRFQSIVGSLQELSHADAGTAIEMWNQLFSSIWNGLQEQDKTRLVQPLGRLLSQSYHRYQLQLPAGHGYRRNVVQTLLRSISKCCVSAPLLPPELIKYLGKTFNAWHIAIDILERRFWSIQDNTRTEEINSITSCLNQLYDELGDQESRNGLRRMTATTTDTLITLDLLALRQYPQAQECLVTTMSKNVSTPSHHDEAYQWERDWITCAKELGQWHVLKEYGQSRDDPNTLLDSAWKLPNWSAVQLAFDMPAVVALAECQLPDTELMLYQIYAAINEGRTKEVETLCRQASQLVLQKWQSLPSTSNAAHLTSLQLFQNLVELEESATIMKDITSASKQSVVPNLNFEQIMYTWRERLPNDWDKVSTWCDVLRWRSHMYNFVVKTFQTVPKANLSRLHDTHWTTLKLASVAQSQGNADLGNHLIHALSKKGGSEGGGGGTKKKDKAFALVPSYLFQKLKDELSVVLDTPSRFLDGISTINGTDLSKLESWQRAELFVFKGRLLEKMGTDHLKESINSFSTALTLSDDQGKLWIEWAKFYDRQLHNSTKGLVSPSASNTQALGCRPLEGHALEYAVSALSTYLHAVHCQHDPTTRLVLARVIRLLQCDDRSERLLQVFANHVEQTPMWCWITWVPQLLHSLSRPEAMHAFSILYGLSNMFPQAVYHSLRCYLLEQRDKKAQSKQHQQVAAAQAQSVQNGTTPVVNAVHATMPPPPFKAEADRLGVQTQDKVELFARTKHPGDQLKESLKYMSKTGHLMQIKPGTTYSEMVSLPDGGERVKPPHEYAEELMGFLRKTHSTLASEIESLLSDVITSFKPGPEEELLSAVLVLQQKCFQLSENDSNTPFEECVAPPSFLATLHRVGERYFKSDPTSLRKPTLRIFFNTFRDQYFDDFVHVETNAPPRTLLHLAVSLERWRCTLQERLGRENDDTVASRDARGNKKTTAMTTLTTTGRPTRTTVRNFRQRRDLVDVAQSNSGYLSLRKKSSVLASFHSNSVEIPGQYECDVEPTPLLHTNLSSLDPYYEIVYRPGLSRAQSRLTFVGSDGTTTSFLVQYCVPSVTPTDQRSMQLHRLTNRLLRLHRGCRSRHLQLHAPLLVPIAPRVRLSKEGTDFVSFVQVYERDCERRGVDALAPSIAMYGIGARAGSILDTSEIERKRRRLVLYEDLCDTMTNPGLLTDYLSEKLPDAESQWKVRQQLTKQWALTSVLSYSFYIEQRHPNKFVFSASRGDLLSLNFRPTYHRNTGQLLGIDHVPFRLTPVLQHVMTPIGVHGLLAESMMSAAACLHDQLSFVEDYATLFFSGDMVPWYTNYQSSVAQQNARATAHAQSSGGVAPTHMNPVNLAQVVDRNVDQVLQRIREMAPLDSAPEHDRTTCMSTSKPSSTPACVNQAVHELIKIASNPANLSMQDPMWAPFF